jgi:hypothetical protein
MPRLGRPPDAVGTGSRYWFTAGSPGGITLVVRAAAGTVAATRMLAAASGPTAPRAIRRNPFTTLTTQRVAKS